MTIVLCAKGYPGRYKKNIRLRNLKNLKLYKNDYIYHAGTKMFGNDFFSNGGRVLNVTSTGSNFLKIRKRIITILKQLKWSNGFFRKDIGWRVIKKNANY